MKQQEKKTTKIFLLWEDRSWFFLSVFALQRLPWIERRAEVQKQCTFTKFLYVSNIQRRTILEKRNKIKMESDWEGKKFRKTLRGLPGDIRRFPSPCTRLDTIAASRDLATVGYSQADKSMINKAEWLDNQLKCLNRVASVQLFLLPLPEHNEFTFGGDHKALLFEPVTVF